MSGHEPQSEKEKENEELSIKPQKDSKELPELVDDGDPPEPPEDIPASSSNEDPPKQNKKQYSESIGKTFSLVAMVSFLSKFFGLARDISILYVFGTSAISDAYFFAYLYTGNILILFGGLGGPFHSSAVSIVTPERDKEETGKLVAQILLITAAFLVIVAIALWLLAPYIVAYGMPGANKEMVLQAFNIMIPLVVIAGLVGAGAGISNVYRVYFWPSIAPAIASIAIIAGIFLFPDKETGVICLAGATLAGAIGQFLVQMPGVIKARPKLPSFSKLEPGIKAYLFMLGPAAIATTIGQLNVYIDAFFVSQLEHGSMTALVNANRLIQLPLGVLLTAMIVPILPRFTEQVTNGDIEELKNEFKRALRVLWFLVLPLVAMLLSMSGPIVELLFQRGSFDESSKAMVVLALTYLIPSVFFYVARDLLTRIFYAHQDSTTPFRIGMAAICVKAVSDYLLVGPLGLGGITLSTTITTIFNMTMLSMFCSKKIGSLNLSSLIKPAIVMLSASALCGAVSWYIQIKVVELITSAGLHFSHFVELAASIAISAVLGLAIYIAFCLMLKLEEPNMATSKIKQMLKRKRNK